MCVRAHTRTHTQALVIVSCEARIVALDGLIVPFFQQTFILGHMSGRHDCFERPASEALFCNILIPGVHVWWAVTGWHLESSSFHCMRLVPILGLPSPYLSWKSHFPAVILHNH